MYHAGFLPALEKQGKTCSMLLGPEELLLVQTPQDTDGVHVTARLTVVRHAAVSCCADYAIETHGDHALCITAVVTVDCHGSCAAIAGVLS